MQKYIIVGKVGMNIAYVGKSHFPSAGYIRRVSNGWNIGLRPGSYVQSVDDTMYKKIESASGCNARKIS